MTNNSVKESTIRNVFLHHRENKVFGSVPSIDCMDKMKTVMDKILLFGDGIVVRDENGDNLGLFGIRDVLEIIAKESFGEFGKDFLNEFMEKTVFQKEGKGRDLDVDSNLEVALEALSRFDCVSVVDSSDHSMLSRLNRLDVLSYVLDKLDDEFLGKSVEELALVQPTVSINEIDAVFEVIPLLVSGVGAFPVENKDGVVIGEISGQVLGSVDWKEWDGSASELLGRAKGSKFVDISRGESVKAVLEKMLDQSVDRVWIMEDSTVSGVVTLANIFYFLSHEATFVNQQNKYYTPNEVKAHNSPDDCWVSILGRVFDITSLVQSFKGSSLIDPLLINAGEDVSHWFDAKTQDLKTYIDPFTNQKAYYTPEGKFPHVPTLNSEETATLPWWRNPEYIIGKLSQKTRMIRICNTLSGQDNQLEVCSEETLNQILQRYEQYNNHASSYTWKRLGNVLDMNKTLQQNGINDEDEEFDELGLSRHVPVIHIYYNDDLKFV